MTDDLPLSPRLRHQVDAFLSPKRAPQCPPRNAGQAKQEKVVVSPTTTIMFPIPMRDLSAPHIDSAHHRREGVSKPREVKPLLTREPLPHDREKKPASQPPKKRKRVMPTKPALSFDPKRNHIPSGRQDPPVSPPIFSKPSASESSASTSSYDEQQRLRFFSDCPSAEHSISSYPATPCTDMNDMSSVPSDFYDSPVSCTSSSSPDPSEQSPGAPEFVVQTSDYARQAPPLLPVYSYGSHVQQLAIHQDPYNYPMDSCPDRPTQGYSVPYFDAAYGRGGPHSIPAYSENSGYSFPPSHRYYD